VENLLKVRRENHGCGPTGRRELHYDQPGYRFFSRTSGDYSTLLSVSHQQQQQQPQEVRYNKDRDIIVSILLNNQ
jgi:hypothetical protein